MKQQTAITLLAVLLTAALSALVAIVLTTDVLAGENAADTPSAINVDVVTPDTAAPPVAADGGVSADGAAPVVDEGQTLAPTAVPTPQGTAAAEPTPNTQPTPSDEPAPDTEPTPDAEPTPDPEPTPDTETSDPEPAPDTETPDTEPTPDTETPDTEPTPDDDDLECPGRIVDGECITISILCLLGYELQDNDCVFVGCPAGHVLEDGYCQPLEIALPCDDGFVRLDDGTCVLDLVVLDPSVIRPLLCGEGFAWVDDECVTICPPDHVWTNGFCLPTFDLDPIIVDLLLDIDLSAAFPGA